MDIEAVACVHNLQYRFSTVQVSTGHAVPSQSNLSR